MGLGYRDWTNGDVPTGDDFDGYLQRQTVMSFASASARDAALVGALDEGMCAYLEDQDVITWYDGSTWRGGWTTVASPALTNVTIGGGGSANTQEYVRTASGVVHLNGLLRIGAAGSVGGTINIAIPFASGAAINQWGSCHILDTSAATRFNGVALIPGGFSTVQFRVPGAAGNGAPMTWAAGDELEYSIAYRPAA